MDDLPHTTKPRWRVGAVQGAALVVGGVCLLWVLELADMVLPLNLDQYGIWSRDVTGLSGIVLAPLLHAGVDHLAANSLPLLILGFISAMRGLGRFIVATAIITVISGVGVWLTGPPHTVTIGASGVVFGYFGYLTGRGIFDRRLIDVVVAAIVVAGYGSLLWGVFPGTPGVSWQAHLFGLIGGVVAARLLRRAAHDRAGQLTQMG